MWIHTVSKTKALRKSYASLNMFTPVRATVCWDQKPLLFVFVKMMFAFRRPGLNFRQAAASYFNLTNWNRWPLFETESLVGIDFNLCDNMRPIQ